MDDCVAQFQLFVGKPGTFTAYHYRSVIAWSKFVQSVSSTGFCSDDVIQILDCLLDGFEYLRFPQLFLGVLRGSTGIGNVELRRHDAERKPEIGGCPGDKTGVFRYLWFDKYDRSHCKEFLTSESLNVFMLDTKVLAAVLVSLAGATMMVNGGASNPVEDGFSVDRFEDLELSPRSLGAFTGLVERPEPDTEVRADLNFNGSLPQEVKLSSATIRPDNFTSVSAGKRQINSESAVSLYGFDGTVNLDRPVRIDGKADGMTSNGVNISGEFKIDERVDTDSIEIGSVRRSSLQLEKVSGTVTSGSSSTRISEGELSITSFNGNMSFNLANSRMSLSGEVAGMEAGSFTLG